MVLERFIVLEQVEADTVEAMGSVDGGLDLGFATIESIEKGDPNGGVVLGGAKAHLVESVAESRIAVLGEMTDSVRVVARTIGDGVITGKGPDLGSPIETIGGTETSIVGLSIHIAQARDGRDMASGRVWDERDKATTSFLDEGFGGYVLEKEVLELLSEGSGYVRWE